jgi:hypothetical protein
MGKNMDHKGRRKEPRHIRLYHSIMAAPAWRAASCGARALLIELVARHNGANNGELFISTREAADLLNVHRNTAARLFHELDELGFTAITEMGMYRVNGGPATMRRLTWLAGAGYPPTRDFEKWRPAGNKSLAQFRSTPGTTIVPMMETGSDLGTTIVPGSTETSHVSNPDLGTTDGTLLVCHRQGRSEGASDQRKQANSANGVSSDIDDDTLADLRQRLISYLAGAPVGAQSRLAEAAAIPSGTLSKFKDGRAISAHHFVNLQLQLRRCGAIDRAAA